MRRDISDRPDRGFTIMELLVVIAIIGVLIAIIWPAFRSASQGTKQANSASNLRQLGAATSAYLTAWNNHLPQKTWEIEGDDVVVGLLFGGKLGTLERYGINEIGADERPLNRYTQRQRHGRQEPVPIFQSPLDIGQRPVSQIGEIQHGGLPGLVVPATSLYDLYGTSYTINDHALEGEDHPTLIPDQTADGRPGGRMPMVLDPSKTWLLGEHPIYNYQSDGDRGQYWYGDRGIARTTLCFVDGHVESGLLVPRPEQGEPLPNTTPDYTFLPRPDWFDNPP